MLKAYIHNWEPAPDPDKNLMHYWFCEAAKDAACWGSQESAEIDAICYNGLGVTIPSSQGGSYLIRDFQVEEFAPDRFVIYANAPFIRAERGVMSVRQRSREDHVS